MQEGRVPLPRRVTLTWIGFTEDGAPAIFDSTALLSVLDRFRRPNQARWVPVLDSSLLGRKQGRVENYWPVGVTNTQLACVILKVSISLSFKDGVEDAVAYIRARRRNHGSHVRSSRKSTCSCLS